MAFKKGLNRKEQLLNAKWLEEGVDPKAIAKKLSVSVSTVKAFTREKLDAADKKAKKRRDDYAKQLQENKKKAAVLNAALDDQPREFS